MVRRASVAAVVLTHGSATARMRALVAELGAPLSRTTLVERMHGAPTAIVESARSATPSRGVVAIAASQEEGDTLIAAGVDEVLLEPVDAASLGIALRRAILRAGVRDDRAIEARTLEQVLEGMSHGAEGPLAALALDLDALRSGTVSFETLEEFDGALDDCSESVEQVARLLRDAHILARADHSEPHDSVQIGALIDQVLRALGGSSALLAHIEVHTEPDVPNIMAPCRLLARTFAQIIVHALNACPADPPPSLRRLRIAIRNLPDSVAIVIDARPGLDAAPPSTPHTVDVEGRLVVARTALRSFEGELIAERAADGGLRFIAFVPRPDHALDVVTGPQATFAAPLRARSRVLIVDADARFLRAATRALSDRFDVVVAASGIEGLSAVRDGGVNAVLLDARLPDMTAGAFIDELHRLNGELARKVVLACHPSEGVASAARTVTKPIRRTTLLSIMDELLVTTPDIAVLQKLLN
jgi:CheY-like chemotaxis protein